MTRSSAESTIVVSAMIVGGIWAYQQYRQGGQNLDLARFATAWGAVFLVLALVAMASPELAAAFSLLVVAGDLLANGSSLISGVTSAENQTVAASAPKNPGPAKDVTHAAPAVSRAVASAAGGLA